MVLTIDAIRQAGSDDDLLKLLSEALNQALPPIPDDDNDKYLARMKALPTGLHAMGAIYELDISMACDDLGFHFANWHNEGLAKETLWALRELGAAEAAEIFECAFNIALKQWDKFGSTGFMEWSGLAIHAASQRA